MVSRSLSVLQVLPSLESGGVERGTLEVGRHLAGQGHRSLVMSAGGRLVDTLIAEGSEHFCWPVGEKSPRTLLLIPRLRRFLAEQQIDIVHVRSRLPAWLVYLAWRAMDPAVRPRLVSTFHGFYSVGAYSSIMTRSEQIIAVSESIAEHIAREYRPQAPVTTIHRGIDPAEYPAGYRPPEEWARAWADEYPRLRGKCLVTLPGRISRLKGHHDLIELIDRLKDAVPNVHGLIVGGQEERHRGYLGELARVISRRQLESQISFTGHRADLREIISVSSLVLSLSSRPESFGRTVTEALALGVPVVAYAHGGVGEIMAAMLPSGAVPVNDLARLHEVCLRFLSQPPVINALPERFTLACMLRRTLAVYEALAGDGRGSDGCRASLPGGTPGRQREDGRLALQV